MTETTPNRPWGWLRRKITVFNYLLLTLPMFVIALILAAVTHSVLPYNIWAVLWAAPLLIVLTLRWVYFVVTLAWAIGVEIFRTVRNRFARPD
ncbi:hypothetical protein [Brevundimonas nasdae]|uniref:Uncharacterized protein n=1 Tax=Brevundimonas nasdae TaxID=172043 RepID=A0ABX8TK30_9CAUL|nr:hypothetical protein [Brevundimonas nasdae]QYC11148.1 hypothetical protein KWG56_03830 [Brevundimonas nasdae]QYC13936.1 hypothetical protein KWG63_17385 [Brevundimonas nasdae]